MVDIHSHVLYGMDDGARSFEASLSMLRMAYLSGTTDIVASPHANLVFKLQPEEIQNQLQRLANEPGIPRLHRACDFHLSFDNIQDFFRTPSRYTINGLRYLLVEFSDFAIPPTINYTLERMAELHVTPIITHPERNPILSKHPEQIAEWVTAGCLVQITGQSLTGRFGKNARSAARHLLDTRSVHFIASDAHDLHHRPPNLLPAFEFVEANYGAAVAAALFVDNGAAVLTGAELPRQPEEVTKPRRWFKLW